MGGAPGGKSGQRAEVSKRKPVLSKRVWSVSQAIAGEVIERLRSVQQVQPTGGPL